MKSPIFLFRFAMLLSTAASVLAADLPPSVPPAQLEAAKQAKDLFERGDYRGAEKIFEAILLAAPDNLYALSNLGVVRFRAGKLKLAADALQRAIAVAPTDDFSHCTLGIVYYTQGSYDAAVNALTKALAINPKNATAHRYLATVATQKGWHDAAKKELEIAETLDPSPEAAPVGDFFTPLEKSRMQLQEPRK